jgi:hypothetical protein
MAVFNHNSFEGWSGDFQWVEPGQQIQDNKAENLTPQTEEEAIVHVGRTVLKVSGLIAVVSMGLGLTGELVGHPNNQVPKFAATKIDGCYVSTDWKWVLPRNGIDDLVIHNVKGPTSESGKGAKCLNAARKIVIKWANHDGYPLNNIDSHIIIRNDQVYAVPLFAETKQPG